MTITEAFDNYTADVIAFKNQSRKTEENHYVCMKQMVRFFGDMDIEQLTFADVRNWKISLEARRSPETVRNYIIKLRVVLAYLNAQGLSVLSPDTIPVPKRTDKVPTYISSEEVAELIEACECARGCRINTARNRAMISLLYASGIRISELCSLNRASIRDDSFTIVGKGGKARLCFVDRRTALLLHAYERLRTDNQASLFVSNETFNRLTPAVAQEVFKNVTRRAGMTKVTPHTMRHSFATNLLKNNMNMRYVQELLGHASLETTQMYTHVVNEDLKAVYNLCHTV
jgi:site-specific recombinase XerD